MWPTHASQVSYSQAEFLKAKGYRFFFNRISPLQFSVVLAASGAPLISSEMEPSPSIAHTQKERQEYSPLKISGLFCSENMFVSFVTPSNEVHEELATQSFPVARRFAPRQLTLNEVNAALLRDHIFVILWFSILRADLQCRKRCFYEAAVWGFLLQLAFCAILISVDSGCSFTVLQHSRFFSWDCLYL